MSARDNYSAALFAKLGMIQDSVLIGVAVTLTPQATAFRIDLRGDFEEHERYVPQSRPMGVSAAAIAAGANLVARRCRHASLDVSMAAV